MTEDADTRLRRLRMRSMRRGIKEMDLILSDFVQTLDSDDKALLDRYEALLSETDLDLYAWISGQEPPPERFAALVAEIARRATGLTRPS